MGPEGTSLDGTPTALVRGRGWQNYVNFPDLYFPFDHAWVGRPHAAASARRRDAYRVDLEYPDNHVFPIHIAFTSTCDGLGILQARGVSAGDFASGVYVSGVCPDPVAGVHHLTNKYAVAFLKTVLDGEDDCSDVLDPRHVGQSGDNVEIPARRPVTRSCPARTISPIDRTWRAATPASRT